MSFCDRLANWKLGRGGYAGWGIGLAFAKYNLDRLISIYSGHGPFFPWSYFLPAGWSSLEGLSRSDSNFFASLALTAVPFVLLGVVLTMGRLRSMGWPAWLAILFFLPLVNLVFFAVLCWALPASAPPRLPESGLQGWLRWILPRNKLAAAAVAVIFTSGVSSALTAISVRGLGSYGWGLFFALPFTMALVAVFLTSVHGRIGYWTCMLVSLLTVLVSGGVLLAIAFEGFICLLMAAPIALTMAWLGGSAGYFIQRQAWSLGQQGPVICVVLAVMPTIFWTDRNSEPPVRSCVTEVRIAAPPAEVWKHVVSFSRIAPPREWVFKTGIAYPIEAVIDGTGAGAVRRCRFSTGDFVEPITIWDEPRRLAFSVASQPEPMQELSPYRNVHPPHLDGYLVSKHGEFLLVAQPDGGTVLRGTTWYQQKLWPQAYWAPLTDFLLHSIHRRVLDHIRAECE